MIYINDKTRISKVDERCLQIEILKEVTSRKTGDTSLIWQTYGYYGDIKSTLKCALKRQLYTTVDEELTLKDLVERIEQVESNIIAAITSGQTIEGKEQRAK